MLTLDGKAYKVFQSTPSARRATRRRPEPRPRCGISIHALREESDQMQ